MNLQQDLAVTEEPAVSRLKTAPARPQAATRTDSNECASCVAEPRLRTHRRIRLQGVLVVPLWLAFALGWWRVLRNWPASDLIRSFELLAAIAALYGLALALWIRHNISIYRRKGPRLAVRPVTADYSRDALGQAVCSVQPGIFQAQHLTIDIAAGEKHYRLSPGPRDFRSAR